MSELSKKNKRELAKTLFLKDVFLVADILKMVPCSSRSFAKWRKEDKWDDLKISYTITKEQELRRIYIQIRELNNLIAGRDENERFASSKEADVLSKLASAAKNLESDTSVSDVIDVFIGFNKFLEASNFNQVKDQINLQDAYIKYKMQQS